MNHLMLQSLDTFAEQLAETPPITAEMLREVFQQTQREILAIATPERYQARWERMAELLNEKLVQQHKAVQP